MIAELSSTSRKLVVPALVAVLAMILWVVGAVLPASASAVFLRVGQFSGPGAGADQMTAPGKAEVRLSDQRLLVADSGNDRVQVFAPTVDGASVQAPLTDAAIDAPHDVAIDQDTGEVYVADVDAIVRFTAAGTLDATFTPLAVTGPIDFDESTDELVVGDRATSTVRRYSRTGLPGTTFDGTNGSTALGNIVDLAVDSTGDVLVVDATGSLLFLTVGAAVSTVERYSAAGTYEAELGPVATPTTVAVEPTTNRVVVGGNIAESYSGGAPLHVRTFAADGAAADGVDLPTSGGLPHAQMAAVAVGEPGGRMYAITDHSVPSAAYGTVSVQAYDNVESPSLTDPVVSDIGGEQADVTASIDPNGTATEWVVEYSADGGASWNGAGGGTTTAGDDPVAIAVTIDGLQPKGSYLVRVRLVLSGLMSAAVPFETPAVAPKVLMNEPAAKVTTTGARLLGAIDPQATATGYWFEYGTTTEYGARVPATAVQVGDGNTWVGVAQDVTGLQPDTTYHYRLVAENSEGTTRSAARTFTTTPPAPIADACPNADIRRQQNTTRLPDCRAYELVSPVHKFNGGVSQGFKAADDGSAVGYMMNAPIGSDSAAHAIIPYAAHRKASGWVNATAAPPITAERRNNGEVNAFAVDYSEDFKTAYLDTNDPLVPDDLDPIVSGSLSDGYDVYAFGVESRQATWLSRPHPDMAASYQAGGFNHYMGRSADGSHVVFRVTRSLLPGVPDNALYEVADGELRPVSVLPNGQLATGQGQIAGGLPNVAPARRLQAISADGSRIYWQNGATSPLYLRENGATVTVSASRASSNPGAAVTAAFLDASADGSTVYFFGPSALLDGAGRGIYRYDRDSDTLTFLLPMTGTVLAGNNFQRPMASESGDRVYFKSTQAMLPGAVANRHNLYLWDGQLKLVAPTSTQSGSARPSADPRLRISPDGRYAVFTTLDSLGPDHRQGVNEIYLYDAQTGDRTCVSCRRDGEPGTEDAHLRPPDLIYALLGSQMRNEARNVTSDGSVFFNTKTGLVPEDSNGARDVYQYDDGELKLISSGRGEPSELLDTSEDGKSVFFITANAHTAHDIDGGYPDVYVARVDGGFPEPAAAPEPCSGDSCQGDLAGGPGSADIGSSGTAGAGDVESRRASLAVAGAKSVRGKRAVLRVRVPAAGRVSVRGAGVRSAARRAARAGTVRIAVRLTAAAAKRLGRRGRVGARVRVAFARSGGGSASRIVRLTFRRPVKQPGNSRPGGKR